MYLIFHDNLFDPNRLVYKKSTRTADVLRTGHASYFTGYVEKPKKPDIKDKGKESKKGLVEEAEDLKEEKKGKESEAGKKSKEKRKGLRKHVESGLYLNKVRDLLKEKPGLFRRYVKEHKPKDYGTGDWKKSWNPDFGKDVIGVNKEHGKYARALQKILKSEEGIKLGRIDGRMGKSTVRALARYLGKGRERFELTNKNEPKYFNAYKRALKAGYPNLDLGRGYIIDRPTFTAIFKDIVGAQVSFNPLFIGGWEGRFKDLMPLVGKDELLRIYPYYPIKKPKEKPKKPPLIAKKSKKKVSTDSDELKKINAREKSVASPMTKNIRDNVAAIAKKYKEMESGEMKNYRIDYKKDKAILKILKTTGTGKLLKLYVGSIKMANNDYKDAYKKWKETEKYYNENIKGTAIEQGPIGKKKKGKLDKAEKGRNQKYDLLEKAIQTHYSELARIHEEKTKEFENQLRLAASKYDFPKGDKVDIRKIGITTVKEPAVGGLSRADFAAVPIQVTHYPEHMKAHGTGFASIAQIRKRLIRIPKRIIKSIDDLDMYIKGTGEEFEKNKIAIAKAAKDVGGKLVNLMNHSIYYQNYLSLNKDLNVIRLRTGHNSYDKRKDLNKIQLASLLTRKNEAPTRYA
jgi:hypothetical protein